MLIFRAFPLSVAITWRFLIAFPVWVVLYFLITALLVSATVHGIGIALIIPLLGPLVVLILPFVVIAVSFMFLVHPYLIATRIGLNHLGVKTDPSQKRLLGAAVVYGVIEWIPNFVIVAIITVTASALVFGNPVTNLTPIVDPIAGLSKSISSGSITLVSAITGVAILALRAAMLPVLANVAAGRDPRGQFYAPMRGFGHGFRQCSHCWS